jgi:hypothetical protein
MESEAERTLHNLHVLGALSQNDKLLTNEDRFDIYCPTTMRSLMRTWYGERRGQNVARVHTTVHAGMHFASRALEEATALIQTHAGADGMSDLLRFRMDTIAMQHVRMIQALLRARDGLRNLLQTYRDDAALHSKISLVMDEIHDFVSVIEFATKTLRAQCPSVESNVGSSTTGRLLRGC